MQAEVQEPVLQMRGIGKRFGALAALRGVDLAVRAGEVHALIGENGAGKSTLMKVLSGAHAPDSGSMQLGGKAYAPRGPLDARALGVAMIYQELALAPELSVAQNIMLGREPARFGWVDRAEQEQRVREVLRWLEQPELEPLQKVGALSSGARQLVEVARALVGNARIVVMDEPTSSLSHTEVERLFDVIARLRARNVAVIYISHFLEEVWRVAQRYTVLRDGQSVDSGSIVRTGDADVAVREEPDAAFTARVIQAMAGRPLTEAYPRVAHEPGEVVLELEALSGVRLPRAVTLAIRRGEILGIAGLVGAGRSELLRTIFGLDRTHGGNVRLATKAAQSDEGATPRARLAQGIGLLSENRKEEGLALGLSIATNLTLSRPVARWGFIARSGERAVTRGFAQQLGLRYQSEQQPVSQLSGGNQQKVALARLLHHGVDVLLLDEPTRGIDVASKAEIYRLMGQLAAQGKAIVFVSSYLPELLGVCDRIAVMNRGRLGEPRARAAWNEATLLEAATAAHHG